MLALFTFSSAPFVCIYRARYWITCKKRKKKYTKYKRYMKSCGAVTFCECATQPVRIGLRVAWLPRAFSFPLFRKRDFYPLPFSPLTPLPSHPASSQVPFPVLFFATACLPCMRSRSSLSLPKLALSWRPPRSPSRVPADLCALC